MVSRQTLMLIITDTKISLKLHIILEQLISCTAKFIKCIRHINLKYRQDMFKPSIDITLTLSAKLQNTQHMHMLRRRAWISDGFLATSRNPPMLLTFLQAYILCSNWPKLMVLKHQLHQVLYCLTYKHNECILPYHP